MAAVDLPALVDAGALVAQEHRAHLDGAVGVADAVVDPVGGVLAFTDLEGRRRTVTAHFVGTASPADGTWLWSWRNINDFPQAFVRSAERVRALGERYGIAELATATLPASAGRGAALAGAVGALTGITATLAVPTGNGDTVAWLLLEDPGLALPRPTVARAVAVVTAALADGTAVDHRRALTAWAQQRGATLTAAGARTLQLALPDGELRIRLDEHDRVTGMGRRAPAPVPPASAAAAGAAEDAGLREVEPQEHAAAEDEPELRLEHLFGASPQAVLDPEEPRTWRDRVRDLFV